ncbi:hypothetical protein [Haladaptatus sp. DJG-WS-42]|uniref:hypothetical protein n=1 Tax=Haladaptatus sp. DJG-WS-42 TaxID=3120516 RepID=UPI0030D08656
MTMKASGTAREPERIDEWEGGFGWIAHPDEGMQRASHALVAAGRVWLVDPVDFEGLDDQLAEHGPVGGVVLLLDRHKRDAAAIARRHDVSVYLPKWMEGVSADLDAPTTLFEGTLADTGYTLLKVYNNSFWNEGALYDDTTGTLVVPEAFGTISYYCTNNERLGVHPAMRLTPPRRPFRGLRPERILVGHGAGITEDAPEALRDALEGAVKRMPKLYVQNLRNVLPF